MDKEITLSEGFHHTVADILDYCVANDTDSVTLTMESKETAIEIDMAFRVRRKQHVESDQV